MKMQKETTCLQYHNTVNGQAKSLSGLLVDGLSEREPFQPFGLGYRKRSPSVQTNISLYGPTVLSGGLLLAGLLNTMYFHSPEIDNGLSQI